MLTVLGAISYLVPSLLFILHDPDLDYDYPRIYYLISAIGVFLYQTFDAIDGAHARNIKKSSPLGQLLDHGLDSFSATIFSIYTAVILGLEPSSFSLWFMASLGPMTTYLPNLNEKLSSVMFTNMFSLGVTEIQFLQIGGLLVNFLFGGSFFKTGKNFIF